MKDLTRGPIPRSLLSLALPIMGTQFAQMAYNITDMFWLGKLGSGALTASGIAGLFLWLSVGLMLIGRVGAEIGVSQSRGRGEMETAYNYSIRAVYLALILGCLYGSFLLIFRVRLVGLFNFKEAHVAADTAAYMGIMALGIPMMFIVSAIGGIYNASGNTRTPFLLNFCGLTANMILDPIVILGLNMGVAGAAWASVAVQTCVAVSMVFVITKSKKRPFQKFSLIGKISPAFPLKIIKDLKEGLVRQIFKWTLPICLESTLFCFLTMLTTRFEVAFGAQFTAVGRVGTQIESLTWLVGAGFGSAVIAFVGQNFGAKNTKRVEDGVRVSGIIMAAWGMGVSLLLFFGGGSIFTLFLKEEGLRGLGITHMRILAICQIPACLEVVFSGAFKGKGRTIPHTLVSITSNAIRVPLAFILSRGPLGVLGVWTAVSVTTALRGFWIFIWYIIKGRKIKAED